MLTTLEIPPEEEAIDPVKQYIYAYAKPLGITDLDWERMQGALRKVLEMMITNIRESLRRVPITLKIFVEDDLLKVQFFNTGRPLYVYKLLKMQLEQMLDHFAYYNHGRDGQEFCLGVKIKNSYHIYTPQIDFEDLFVEPEKITICELKRKQASKLSKLFYSVYGYRYIHEYVYYPDEIEKMMAHGDLLSQVAVLPDGQIVGHVGLVRINTNPVVYEAALGVVDPSIKSQGLFSRLFKKVIELVDTIPMQYCLYDFVTNHDYSQRQVYKYHSCEMSILVGGQLSSTQAKLQDLGMGSDPQKTDRYSILMSIRPQVPHPFGREIVLPVNLGEMTEFLLEPLGVEWTPAPRFYPLPPHGKYRTIRSLEQKTVHFDLYRPGRDALQKLVEEWRYYLRSGHQYVSVDVPLDCPGIGQVYDFLARKNFFISGYIPYNKGDRLGLRFQSLGPVRVAFDEIHLFSDNAKRLLAIIEQDYQRNCLL